MGDRSRRWGPVRIGRGSVPPDDAGAWLTAAVRAAFPKLAASLGARGFDAMFSSFLARAAPAKRNVRETGERLAEYLASAHEYPIWYGEIARLDRAHSHVLHAPPAAVLARRDVTLERELRLVPAHALVEITTNCDELWHSLDRGGGGAQPRSLDWPRHVLVWRTANMNVRDRVLDPDETAALRAAARGTSIVELAAGFTCDNAHARVIDLVLRWLDGDLILG